MRCWWLLVTADAFPPASFRRQEAGRLTRASGKHSDLPDGKLAPSKKYYRKRHAPVHGVVGALITPQPSRWHGTRYHRSCEAG